MFNKLRDMSPSDKNKLMIVIGVLLGAVYFGLWYPSLSKQADHEKNMVNRRLNRMETRIKAVKEPTQSVSRLQRQLSALDEGYENLSKQMELLSVRFIPLDKPRRFQNVRLRLSELAARSGIDIQQVRSAVSGDPGVAPPSAEIIALEAKNRFGRPLLSFSATATYSGLMQFLEELKAFPSNVAVVRLSIEADRSALEQGEGEQEVENTSNEPQALSVTMLLAM